MFQNVSKAWFAHLQNDIPDLLSQSYWRFLIFTHLAHNRYLIIFPFTNFLHPYVQTDRKHHFYRRTSNTMTKAKSWLRESPRYQDNEPAYLRAPAPPPPPAPWNTQVWRVKKATYSSSSSESQPAGPDSTAMTSFFTWLCFQVLLPVEEGDSFLFFFPKNFLNVLNLDFFFPMQKDCVWAFTKHVPDAREQESEISVCASTTRSWKVLPPYRTWSTRCTWKPILISVYFEHWIKEPRKLWSTITE